MTWAGVGIGMIAGQTEQSAMRQRSVGTPQRGPLQDISGRHLYDVANFCHVQHSQVLAQSMAGAACMSLDTMPISESSAHEHTSAYVDVGSRAEAVCWGAH